MPERRTDMTPGYDFERIAEYHWHGRIEYKDRTIIRDYWVADNTVEVTEVYLEREMTRAVMHYSIPLDLVGDGQSIGEMLEDDLTDDISMQVTELFDHTVRQYERMHEEAAGYRAPTSDSGSSGGSEDMAVDVKFPESLTDREMGNR